MAGDWIKMRVDLAADPAVIGISSALDCTEFEVVGMLHHFWSWADAQSRDGHAGGVTKKWVDRYVHCEGFADQLEKVGWLVSDDDGITVPNFDKHNGQPAKTRALGAKRQQNHRGSMSRDERDESVTREEKRREEKNKDQKPVCGAFESFWKMYPAKKGKTPARKAWAKAARSPEVIQQIMQGLANHLTCRQWTKDGGEYIPNPSSWLNQERWNDEVSHGPANTERSRPLSAVERVAAKAAERECQRQRVVETEPGDGFLEGEYSRAN